jgi:hypothetical protein
MIFHAWKKSSILFHVSWRFCLAVLFSIINLVSPLVQRCNGTTAGHDYLKVDKGCLAKIPPWAVNLCPHQGVGSVSGSAWIRINLSCWIRIRIRIQIADPDPDPGGQNWPKKIKKRNRIFIFWSAGCSLLRAEGFSCSLGVLYVGLEISKLQFLIKKIKIIFLVVNFFQF